MIEVFFDLETKKLFQEIESKDPSDLGVSVVSVYSREVGENNKELHGTMKSFWEKDFSRKTKKISKMRLYSSPFNP